MGEIFNSNLIKQLEKTTTKERFQRDFVDRMEMYIENLDDSDYQTLLIAAKSYGLKRKFQQKYNEIKAEIKRSTSKAPRYVGYTANGKEVIDDLKLSQEIETNERYYFVRNENDDKTFVYWYDKFKGVYELITSTEVKQKIKSYIINNCDNESLATVKSIEDTYKQMNYTEGSEHNLKSIEEFDKNENIIVFENAVLNLETMTPELKSPDNMCTVKIPCNWNSEETNTPTFDKFIKHLANDDAEAEQTLLEAIGFCISNVDIQRFKASIFLIGDGNSGKSKFFEFITQLISSENTVAMPFEKLDKRFQAANLYRKRLAYDDDCNYMGGGGIDVLKEMTGGGGLQAEFKSRQPFTFFYKGLYMLASNDLPMFTGDKGEHVYKRIIPIQCGDSIPEEQQNKHLLEELYKERDGIVTKAIKALKRAMLNNYRFTIGESSRQLLNRYKVENNSVLKFIEECCIDSSETPYPTPKAVVWSCFKSWCTENNEPLPTLTDFKKALAIKYNTTVDTVIKASRGIRFYPCSLNIETKQLYHIVDKIS